jgi:hypothetical protein
MIADVWLISYADGSRIIPWSIVAWFQWVRCRPAPLLAPIFAPRNRPLAD